MATLLTSGWSANDAGVHVTLALREGGESREISMVSHPGHLFRAQLAVGTAVFEHELRDAAEKYLARVATLDADVAKALTYLTTAGNVKGFGWMPIRWGGRFGVADPRSSFVVERVSHGVVLDQAYVLLAANRTLSDDGSELVDTVNASGVGLSVVMHVDEFDPDETTVVSISCVSMSGLARVTPPDTLALSQALLDGALELIAVALGVPSAATVRLSAIEESSGRLRLTGPGVQAPQTALPRPYLWHAEFDVSNQPALMSLRMQEQVSSAGVAADLFTCDPASSGAPETIVKRRPSRRADLLDLFRTSLPNFPPTLTDPGGRFEVRQSAIANRPDPTDPPTPQKPGGTQTVDPTSLPLRSDDLASAHAYQRAREFFDRIASFDLPADKLFKFAKLPLRMQHRAAFAKYPDGNGIIAQVRLGDLPLSWLSKGVAIAPPQLEVAFGWADLRHRDLQPNDDGALRCQPLGLAADPRWAWHEFGHVVSYAATGVLEFHFAHSFGDALAAVLSDPESLLVNTQNPVYRDLYRGDTYPWVDAGRRHDRSVALGWCWCGRRNGQRKALPVIPPPLFKRYIEEQMLSTSVFRLYDAIGGLPDNPPPMRLRAAQSAAYLLIKGAQLMPPQDVVVARTVETLVQAMIDADISTQSPTADLFEGGCLHKVVRWAFERQGLYATDNPDQDVEGSGLPPDVDVWMADQRPGDPGGYEPVPLDWPTAPGGADPRWFADSDAVWVESGDVYAVVQNRGGSTAKGAVVEAWIATAAATPLNWQYVGSVAVDDVPGGGLELAVIPGGLQGAGLCLLLVQVSADGDLSNLDAAASFPCSTGNPPADVASLRDLVANDNNIALQRVDIP